VLGGVDFSGSVEFSDFEIFFALFLGLPLFCLLLAFAIFLLLDDLFSFSCLFWSSSCASWCFGFELQILSFLLSIDSSRGRLRSQVISSLV
jgi:hypothetical protein